MIFRFKEFLLLAAFTGLQAVAYCQNLQAGKFGAGVFHVTGQDSSWSMVMGLRFQTLSVSTFDFRGDELVDPRHSFAIRRSRLKFDGHAFSPKFRYKIELGLSGNDLSGASSATLNAPLLVLDAVGMWEFADGFELWFGQTKLPGNVERVISSANMQLVDRSLLNNAFNLDRDLGLQLRHSWQLGRSVVIREILALSQGEGRNIGAGNIGGHEYTGRIEILPFGEFKKRGEYSGSDLVREQNPRLMLAYTYDFNNNAVKTRSNLGSYMGNDVGIFETNINSMFLDIVFKYKGFSIMSEMAVRDAENPVATNSDGSPTGAFVLVGRALNFQTGYLFQNNMEIAGRYTIVDFDNQKISSKDQDQFTLGISRYFAGHKLKLQSDLSYLRLQNENENLMYRLQFEIHF